MAISREHHEQAVKAAWLEAYEACWTARQSQIGFDAGDAERAWLASKAYRALSQSDGGGA